MYIATNAISPFHGEVLNYRTRPMQLAKLAGNGSRQATAVLEQPGFFETYVHTYKVPKLSL